MNSLSWLMIQSWMLRCLWFSAILGILVAVSNCKEANKPPYTKTEKILPEINTALDSLAHLWYPKTVDTLHGGFWTDFNARWEKEGPQQKMIVTQARHLWTSATLADYYKDPAYKDIARHGYEFLRDHMWDESLGGFHTLLEVRGDSLHVLSNTKSAYGNAFAIYGLSAYYKASQDIRALDLAKKTFYWLEQHARDTIYKGYFDVLGKDGSWLLGETRPEGMENFERKDWKDQNSSIHLLEAFTALYQVWPHHVLKDRLDELLVLVRDTLVTEKGYLILHLERDWTPVSFRDSTEAFRKEHYYLDHVSFGHDIETAYLMLEAAQALGKPLDSLTLSKARKMVDHALEHGWDKDTGGFYDGGYYQDNDDQCTLVNPAKVWWAQAEGLNSLLMMAMLFPEEKQYYDYFEKQWAYLKQYMIDDRFGGWYHEGLDTNPEAKDHFKAHMWKGNYHNIRALLNVRHMLKGDFELTGVPVATGQ